MAGIVTLIPEGLVLLLSLTFAAAALQLARRGALAQQLNATESLAAVDVLCLDKTGTLTHPASGSSRSSRSRSPSRSAASPPARRRRTRRCARSRTRCPAEAAAVEDYEPFSSDRRYSALTIEGERWRLGAPELFDLDALGDRAAAEREAGRRVLAFGNGRAAQGLVVLAEELRGDARSTVEFFRQEGVELRVISGDNPDTVAAIARDAGIPVDRVVDASEGEPALDAIVIGRISPEGKKAYVERLRDSGRYVAMVGDGVNDVPALKAARLAIAQGSGSEMARSVADVVLVGGDFASVPSMVVEGRKILRNVQRVAKLFVTKSAFAAFLILLIGLTETAYPLLPRHLTLAATLTIGIPGFFLALGPSEGSWSTAGFLREVARFAIPAGTAAALGVLSAYHFALNVVQLPLVEARTVATSVLVLVGLYFVLVLESAGTRRRRNAVGALCAAMLLLYVLTLSLAGMRDFFDLVVPGFWSLVAIALGTSLTITGLVFTDDRFVADLGVKPFAR